MRGGKELSRGGGGVRPEGLGRRRAITYGLAALLHPPSARGWWQCDAAAAGGHSPRMRIPPRTSSRAKQTSCTDAACPS